MRYSLGILLLIVGAVLAFAVQDNIAGVDLVMTGYIFMGAGALALIVALLLFMRGRRTEVVHSHSTQ